jgi:hypothetical protein
MSKRTFVIAITLLALLTSARAQGCGAIQDHDKRQECLAIERRDPQGCQGISNAEGREICRQRVGLRPMGGDPHRPRQ